MLTKDVYLLVCLSNKLNKLIDVKFIKDRVDIYEDCGSTPRETN